MVEATGGTACLGVFIAVFILCALTLIPWERVIAVITNALWPEKASQGGGRPKKKRAK